MADEYCEHGHSVFCLECEYALAKARATAAEAKVRELEARLAAMERGHRESLEERPDYNPLPSIPPSKPEPPALESPLAIAHRLGLPSQAVWDEMEERAVRDALSPSSDKGEG